MVKLTTGTGPVDGARGETRLVFCAIRLVRRDYREESGRVDDHQPILMTEGVMSDEAHVHVGVSGRPHMPARWPPPPNHAAPSALTMGMSSPPPSSLRH